MNIVVNILQSHLVDADQEIPVEQIEVKGGKLFIAGQRHEVVFIGDHRNEFIGLGTDENGLPYIRSRCRWFDGLRDRDDEIDWGWGDVMLAPIVTEKRPLVYLAGAIDNISKGQALTWREEATEILSRAPFNCDTYNPLDVTGTPAEMIEQNERALKSADVVLAELHLPALHYGTVCEVEEALSHGTPVVAWMEDVKPPIYLVIRHPEVIVETTKLDAFYVTGRTAANRLKQSQAG